MPQALAPVIVGITGLSATAATFVASAVLYAGTTAASYLIQQANQPKQDIGTKLHAASGGAVNQSIIVGEKETAGSLIHTGSWGKPGKTPNGFYVRVFCLQDMPSSALLSRCWTSDNKGTIDLDHISYTDKGTDELFPADGSGYTGSGYSMGHPITTLDHDGFHYAWVKFLDGSQVTADPYLLGKFGIRVDRPWTSTMIGRGRTLMIVTQSFTSKEANAEKNVAVVVQGMPLYDWRKDSTNGGSGSHRWGDASTYEYTANPVVILYNIMRGIYRSNTWMYGGLNWPARRFDNDSWTAAANVCDENVTLADDTTEKRYRMGAEINLGEPPLTVMDRILATFSGRLVESGGIYEVYAGGIGASVYSFTDADIVITEPLTGKMFPSREEICNTITGSYCEPNNGGQMKAYAKRTNADYVAADNDEPLSKQMDFDYVRGNTQAQRLAKHALNDNRRFMTKTIALPSLGRKLEPGDVVNWSDSVRFGFTNKKFILGDVTLTNRGVVLGILREADATDADWSVSDERPYTVGIYGDIVPDSQTIEITVTAVRVKNQAGTSKVPALDVAWDIDADMVDCKAVRWRVRPFGVSDIMDAGRVEFDEGHAVIKSGICQSEVYQVQAKIIPYSDRETEWCDWVTISVGDFGSSRTILTIRKQKLVDKATTLNWSGSTAGQKYIETVTVPASIVPIKNNEPSPVTITADTEIVLLVTGATPDSGQGAYLAAVRMFVEAQAPGESEWKIVAKTSISRKFGRDQEVMGWSRRRTIVAVHRVRNQANAGTWHYRVRLDVIHRRGTNNFGTFRVMVAGAFTFLWDRDR